VGRAAQARRIFLGKRRTFGSQQRTYRTPDYLEIDDVENYDVTRRRIFYDEVMLVTLHTRLALAQALALGLTGMILGIVALALAREGLAVVLIFGAPALSMLAFAVLLFVRRVGVVTVFGKRTRAQMEFWWRATRAREAYQLVGRLARERQAQLARRAATPGSEPASAPQDT
jgi:hypothetical protein